MGGACTTPNGEARAKARLILRHPALITLLDETRIDGWTVDLSYGGICVRTEVRLRLTQYCAVRFSVTHDDALQTVLALGQVAYSEPEPQGGFRSGIRFIKVDDASTQAIDRLLREA
ncbi:MAG: PilZ domain-containing protein, partial [Burkholderiaceae bacterium]|nr:PilZ domain-containing protein [Burkholderiaceae bacterium]